MSLICDMPNLKSNPNQLGYYPRVINNQLCKFSNQQVWLPEVPQEINSIEINFEFTTGNAVSGDYWVLLGQKGSNRTCPQIEIDGSQIQFYTSADTSSWLTRMVAPVEVNTTYILNAKWNNTDKKIIATLTDKEGTTVPLTVYSGYTDTTDGIVWEDYGTLCSDGGGHFFNGLFDLSKSYIKINGSMWWKGLTKVDCSHLLAQPFEALGGVPDQDDEGGDIPVTEDVGTMYQQTSSDGTTWSQYSEMASNTVAELANLRPFGTGNRALENYWAYTGKLTLTITFTYANSVDATWYNNPFTIYYTKNGYLYYSGIHVEDNKISLSYVDAISKNLTAGHTYSIKLCLNAETNKAEFYFKEIGVDNSYTFVEARDTGSTYSGAMSCIILGNSLIGQNPTAYHHFADFDLSDITIDIDGEVIFSRT